DEAIATVEGQVVDPVALALAQACLEITGPLEPVLGPVIDTAGELITAIEKQGGDVLGFEPEEGTACDLLLRYVLDPPPLVEDQNGDGTSDANDVLAVIQQELAAALDGSILDVLLAGSDSSTTETDAAITAVAEAIGMDVALPSLNLLGNLTDALLGIVTDYLTLVEGEVGEVINFDALELPLPSELVQTLQDAIPAELQNLLGSEQPLLTVTGGQANPTATYDRDAEEASTSGTVAPLIIDLNDDLAALLGLSDQDPITIPEGGSQTLAADTPLESTFTLAACTSENDLDNADGIPGARIHCAGLELVLLKGVIGDNADTEAFDGGLRLAGAAATAEVYGQALAAPAEDEPSDMPATGGGFAILGLVAIGGAIALRRRD
ncbi:MAG: hypothetical protein R3320_03640, partial [Nitriliruptorales bacterium]|nr:hypothetical protein [Nitriliruptorales bacterium]